eukprot:TRINITY_DN10249_c0_g1_i2.p1 TRINITY_DN10249_c0_g1~~TRINITY_DN10249_c0_g1_i2.p1  ORF type:complete len:364 (+),score=54.00 TRINITY_DN10249_c0_g1_i2:74-1093(+)
MADMRHKFWSFQWAHGSGRIQSHAGMLGPVHFRLGNRTVQPFLVAAHSFVDSPEKDQLDPILREGPTGDWPCVPFGAARPIDNLQPEWEKVKWEQSEGPPHGHSSNGFWQLVSQTPDAITLQFEYPADHPIERLVRVVRFDPNAPALDLELQVHPRADVTLAIGLHPSFNLEDEPRTTLVCPGSFKFGLTFAGNLEPSSILAPGHQFTSLSSLELADGSKKDFSKLPLPENTENLAQLCGIDGTFELVYMRREFTARLEWNPEHFPSLLLWMSNRGRPAYPWSGRHVGLGAEPVCAPFDLGSHVGANPENPIRRQGVATSIDFKKGQVWTTKYRISVRE